MGDPDIAFMVASQTSMSNVIWPIFQYIKAESKAQVQVGLWQYSHLLMELVTVHSDYFYKFHPKTEKTLYFVHMGTGCGMFCGSTVLCHSADY